MTKGYQVHYQIPDLADCKIDIEATNAIVEPDGSLVFYNGRYEQLDHADKDVIAGFAPGIWIKFIQKTMGD